MTHGTYKQTIETEPHERLQATYPHAKRADGKADGLLVALGFGVAAFTPAPYQRHSL